VRLCSETYTHGVTEFSSVPWLEGHLCWHTADGSYAELLDDILGLMILFP